MANKQKSINKKNRRKSRKSRVGKSRARNSRVRKSRARKSRVRKSRARKSRVRKSRARKSRVRRTKLTSSMQGGSQQPQLITFLPGTVFYRGTQGDGNSGLENQILWLALDQKSAEIYTDVQGSKLFKYSVKNQFSVYNMADTVTRNFVLTGIATECAGAFPYNPDNIHYKRDSTPENDRKCFPAIQDRGNRIFNRNIIGVGSSITLNRHHPEVALFNGINGLQLKDYLNFAGEIKIEEAARRPPPPPGKHNRRGDSSNEGGGGGRTLF